MLAAASALPKLRNTLSPPDPTESAPELLRPSGDTRTRLRSESRLAQQHPTPEMGQMACEVLKRQLLDC